MYNSNNGSRASHVPARRMIILTEGNSQPVPAKTAVCVLRYQPDQVVALLDSTQAGKTTEQVLDVGGSTPFISSIDEAPEANTLMIGIAPLGGRMPDSWRQVILAALDRRMTIISGLHQFLSDDPEFAQRAAVQGVSIIDVRKNEERDIAHFPQLREDCLRIQTVGHDCCVGKMVVSVEITNALKQLGVDAKFVATGQTGIMIEGDGCPVDCVVSDFVNGAAEKLVLANQHHEVLLIEGQGSLAHPSYSAVTLGLLHGSRPHGLIMCYEVGRDRVDRMEHAPLKSLDELCNVYEQMANLMHPCSVIGVAMNSRKVSDQEATEERENIRRELGLPVCDVIRHGPDELVEAVQALRAVPATH